MWAPVRRDVMDLLYMAQEVVVKIILCGRGANVVVEEKLFLLENENSTCAMDDAF